MKRQINNTLLELITGIIISAAVVEVLSILVAGFSWKFTCLKIGALRRPLTDRMLHGKDEPVADETGEDDPPHTDS